MSPNGTDPMYARLSERVENQGKDIVDLRSNMNTGFQSVHASLNALSNEFRNNSKTQWPVIWSAAGVCTAALVAAGTFVYGTIGGRQDRVEASLVTVVERMVTQKEMEWRTARGQEDRQRSEVAIKELRSEQVPRGEHERVWSSYDQRFIDQQRQIDEVKQAQGSVYGQRDVILDLRERLDRVERQRLSAINPG
jgi:hypothetical protein